MSFFKSFFIQKYNNRVNHKSIGTYYIILGYWAGLGGSVLSIFIRLELSRSGGILLFGSGQVYNAVLTIHGVLIIFFMVMPILIGGFGNWILPLILGAPEMAFPRLNALSFWFTLVALFLVYHSFFIGTGAGGRWTFYPPLNTRGLPEMSTDTIILSLHTVGFGSLLGAINFISTVQNIRGTSVTLDQIRIFIWTLYLTSLLLLLSVPVLAGALLFLLLDRNFNCSFYDTKFGGNPLLYQHLFWFFGHPEVYIIILPAFGVIRESVLFLTDKERLFGQTRMAFASMWIALLGLSVWGHHIYTAGVDVDTRTYFRAATIIIAIPRAIKVFNWLGSLYGSSQIFQPLWCWTYSFVFLFTIGGLRGIILRTASLDVVLHDTYYVVAHFHYTLRLGAVFAIFRGFCLWFPYLFGVDFNKNNILIVYFCFFIGTNLTFFPLHFAGIKGIPRKILDYPDNFIIYQDLASIGSIITFGGLLLFNYVLSESVKLESLVCFWSYNFHGPLYLVGRPLPESFEEEIINSGLHWKLVMDEDQFLGFRRAGFGFFTK